MKSSDPNTNPQLSPCVKYSILDLPRVGLSGQEKARAESFKFTEIFYNRQRLHQSLVNASHVQFEVNSEQLLFWCPRDPG